MVTTQIEARWCTPR